MLRSIIFWTHLTCGVICGVVVFTMSFTGVMLTYERQIRAWDASRYYAEPAAGQQALALETLIERQQALKPDFSPASVVLTNAEGAPVTFRAGRQAGASLNPYTGEAMVTGSPGLNAFFRWNTGFHRWFNVEGENRAVARQVTGVSNVAFLFLVLSGLYLWLPRFYKWSQFRVRLLFNKAYPNSKARDFHWHHVFGIWAAIPLIAVVYTGAVISYPWAANFMYRVFGAEIPAAGAGRPGGGAGQGAAAQTDTIVAVDDANYLSLSALVEHALNHDGRPWERLTVSIPQPADTRVQIEIDQGNGAQAQLRETLVLDRSNGAVVDTRGFGEQPKQQQLRGIARFLHTGEVLGFWGQTIAGLASLASLFLVWTGLALSYRRLIVPLLRRRRAVPVPSGSAMS